MKKEERQLAFLFVAIILAVVIFFYVVPQLTPPAELRINLQVNQLVKGDEGVLFYKVTNNKNIPLENVTINNSIVGERWPAPKIEDVDLIENKQSHSGVYKFNTGQLDLGPHSVKTVLTYTYQGELRKEELTLGFEIF